MYPHTYFDLFPPMARTRRVFVAMSFDKKFDSRYGSVIVDGIKSVDIAGLTLDVHRVDSRHVSDSILTEILQGISDDQLVLADVTTIGYLDNMPVRNANVMYEVGLAHAVRRAEEVLVFRSDDDALAFDLANIRVNHYDPDRDPQAAKKMVATAIQSALDEQNLMQSLAVRRALSRLDARSVAVLLQAMEQGDICVPSTTTMHGVLGSIDYQRAIDRLLDVGAIVTKWPPLSPNLESVLVESAQPYHMRAHYELTELGKQLIILTATDQVRHLNPEQLDKLIHNWNQKTKESASQSDGGDNEQSK
jgi:hypothetical protein